MIEQDCYSINHAEDQGKITSRDLMIHRDSRPFIIRVGTAEYANQIRTYNEGLDPTLQIDNNIYVMDDVTNPEEICQKLAQIPFPDLEPYLTEQVELPEEKPNLITS